MDIEYNECLLGFLRAEGISMADRVKYREAVECCWVGIKEEMRSGLYRSIRLPYLGLYRAKSGLMSGIEFSCPYSRVRVSDGKKEYIGYE